jgi:hypothetical protein
MHGLREGAGILAELSRSRHQPNRIDGGVIPTRRLSDHTGAAKPEEAKLTVGLELQTRNEVKAVA